MNIIFISTGIYPNQHAAAIRHSTIAQGIVENGHELNFFILTNQPWEDSVLNYKGVTYNCLNDYQGGNKIRKYFFYFKAITKLKKALQYIHSNNKIDGIVIFSLDIILIKVMLWFSNKNRIKIFHERTELPYIVGRESTMLGTIFYNYYINHLIPGFDGIFVISDKLKTILSNYNKNVIKILTVVDIEFFKTNTKRKYDFPYIAYCGNMESKKDGLSILLESFAQLSNDFPLHKLLLIGHCSNDLEMKSILQTINKLKIQDKVILTGYIERETMPGLLCNAELLVVSKPDNEQNSGNFPIKIGEYLATGVPIVVTKVGEISSFIKDGYSGYLAEPNSVDSFHNKMAEALTNNGISKQVGRNGQKLAEAIFDYKIQSYNMLQYMNKTNLSYGN